MASGPQSQTGLSMEASRHADCLLVKAEGRVDHTNAQDFLARLRDEAGVIDGEGGMVIDLSGLEFITSAGLRALMQTKTLVAQNGGRLVIAGTAGTVAEVIRIARFDTLLTLAPSPREGLALLSPDAAASYSG